MDLTTVEQEALRLSPEERAKLAHRLLLSLDTLSAEELDQAWLIEASRRSSEIDRGDVQLTPAEEVQRKARALLK